MNYIIKPRASRKIFTFYQNVAKKYRHDIIRGGTAPLTPIFSFSLAQRKEVKETSTLTKPLPIWRGCKLKIAETAIFRTFLVSRDVAMSFLYVYDLLCASR